MDDAEHDLDLAAAAAHLGMSPMALAPLLDRGVVPSHLGRDGRHRRMALADLDAYREERFALRQHLSQQARARRHPSYGPETAGVPMADVVIVA